jgi:hypothetical protein
MAAINQTKDAPRSDRSERNVLLTLGLVAAAEICVLAWLFY